MEIGRYVTSKLSSPSAFAEVLIRDSEWSVILSLDDLLKIFSIASYLID
jgi:hypothetical protein